MQVRCVIFTSIYLKLHFGWLSTYNDKLFLKFYSKTLKLRTVMQFVQNKDDVSEILFLLTGFQWQTHWWSYTRQSIIKQFHFKHWTLSTNYFRLVWCKGVKRLCVYTNSTSFPHGPENPELAFYIRKACEQLTCTTSGMKAKFSHSQWGWFWNSELWGYLFVPYKVHCFAELSSFVMELSACTYNLQSLCMTMKCEHTCTFDPVFCF
jgi:hypothetical protein